MTKLKIRVVALRHVRACDLKPHPKNWRTHPEKQIAALRAVFDEIGFAGALIAFRYRGNLTLLNGHGCQEAAGEETVPVLETDLKPAEAKKFLATFDTIAGMAGTDQSKLDELVAGITTENESIAALLTDLSDAFAPEMPADEDDAGGSGFGGGQSQAPEVFQVVAECESESAQRELYEELTRKGYTCRLLNL